MVICKQTVILEGEGWKEDFEENLIYPKYKVPVRRAVVASEQVATNPKETEIGTESHPRTDCPPQSHAVTGYFLRWRLVRPSRDVSQRS